MNYSIRLIFVFRRDEMTTMDFAITWGGLEHINADHTVRGAESMAPPCIRMWPYYAQDISEYSKMKTLIIHCPLIISQRETRAYPPGDDLACDAMSWLGLIFDSSFRNTSAVYNIDAKPLRLC